MSLAVSRVKKLSITNPVLCLLFLLPLLQCSAPGAEKSRELNLFVWSAYIPDSVLKKFEERTSIRINYDTYESNEALLEKLQSGVSRYDVAVPSDYMVRILSNQSLLEKLDHRLLPNVKNIESRFLSLSYDPANEVSIPFLWSTSGIGYNKSKVTEPVNSWSILWNPKYKERILMLDDMRECFSAALKWKGYSLNSARPDELEEARDLLRLQKPLVRTYNSSAFDEILLAGDVWLAHAWSGNMVLVMEQDPNLDYVIPGEGAPYAVENFVIPRGAGNIREAHEFINFCHDPEIAAEITNIYKYPNTNLAARAFIRPEILSNPVCYPDQKILARCELMEDTGSAYQLLDRYWTEIKSK